MQIMCDFSAMTASLVANKNQEVAHNIRTALLVILLYSYCCYTVVLVLRRIFGPRWDNVTGEWKRLHNEELNDLYS